MTIRVLHIFAPNFRQRFGGPIFNWQLYFAKWNDASVDHFVLDTEAGTVLPAKEAFDFDLSGPQKLSTRWERLTWAFRLINSLRKFRNQYDLIHFHILLWGSLLAAAWASLREIPTIFESVLLGADTPDSIGKERLGWFKLLLLRKFSMILTISEGLAESYLLHGFPPAKVYMQMNTIDTELFHPIEGSAARQRLRVNFSLPADGTVLLFTGSLIQRKGVDLLVDAFIEASRENPELFLWLVGPRDRAENPSLDEAYVDTLKKRLSTAKLDRNVSFYGMIAERETLAEAYQAADIFVFPSRNEGLPNVVLEAMSCGLPVIVSDLPGLKNVIESNENGVIFSLGDETQLVESIKSLLHAEETAGKLGSKAREYILKKHTFKNWQTNMAELYRDLSK